jgi:plasmid stabilization system protein ParE
VTQLRYTERAVADLDEILDYLTREGGERVALDFNESVRRTCLTLCAVPHAAGTPLPHFRPGLRRHPHDRYNLYFTYDSEQDILYLVRVLHSARHITPDQFA